MIPRTQLFADIQGALPAAMPSLKYLRLSLCTHMANLAPLSGCTALAQLDMSVNGTYYWMVCEVSGLHTLTSVTSLKLRAHVSTDSLPPALVYLGAFQATLRCSLSALASECCAVL